MKPLSSFRFSPSLVCACVALAALTHCEVARAESPRFKPRPSALEILRFGDPAYCVPVVAFSFAGGMSRGRMFRSDGSRLLPDDAGMALSFPLARGQVLLPGGPFTISITRWPNEPRIVRMLVIGDARFLPLMADDTVDPEMVVTDGVTTRSVDGNWTILFEAGLPSGEFAVITGSPTIENVMYDFSVEATAAGAAKKK